MRHPTGFRPWSKMAVLPAVLAVVPYLLVPGVADAAEPVIYDAFDRNIVDPEGGGQAALAIVSGRPAIAYVVSSNEIRFTLAEDTTGASWGDPVLVLSDPPSTASFGSLRMTAVEVPPVIGIVGREVGKDELPGPVQRVPAIAYLSFGDDTLHYVRADDVGGERWQSPLQLGVTDRDVSLIIVSGRPAVAYSSPGGLKYRRATGEKGDSWGSAKSVDGNDDKTGFAASMAVVDGRPAIAYVDEVERQLKFIRAEDETGNSWGEAVDVVDSVAATRLSLGIADGRPAIAYQDPDFANLKFVRAADSTGSSWGGAATVDTETGAGETLSLAVVDSRPAIAYLYTVFDGNDPEWVIAFAHASDRAGNQWTQFTIVEGPASVGASAPAPFTVVDGRPAIAYFRDGQGLKYGIGRQLIPSSEAFERQQIDGQSTDLPVGEHASLGLVNGGPAIVYRAGSEVRFIGAEDKSGSAWSAPVRAGPAAESLSLATVELEPVIGVAAPGQEIPIGIPRPRAPAYAFGSGTQRFVRASTVAGDSWEPPESVDGTGSDFRDASLAIVDDRPAMAYYKGGVGNLRYARALGTSGDSWGAPIDVDTAGDVGRFASLAVVDGNPAVAYYEADNGDLKYVRADDAAGDSWGTPAIVWSVGDVGRFASMKVVNGRPAIAFYDETGGDLLYIRAQDAVGGSWSSAVIADGDPDVGQFASMAVIGGHPGVAYYNATDQNLRYVEAVDSDGQSWGAPLTVDSPGDVGQFASLARIDNRPAIAYFDKNNGDLRYALLRPPATAAKYWNLYRSH